MVNESTDSQKDVSLDSLYIMAELELVLSTNKTHIVAENEGK
ncbi:hypothetical protein M8C21_027336 [Ambrosia artemisiifolia]|uniref:Uncharacterized protein n=1 Tax=Ambrosia artemisiifolia TaxID=4212 RepID=A0AAD5GKJ2_AMBAR|nr:hypothetical protein M8C21_027336 [Ambrosia artemisiifolia]